MTAVVKVLGVVFLQNISSSISIDYDKTSIVFHRSELI